MIDPRTFNREHYVTGVLLHSGRHFMQCLEGAPDNVDKVYARIKRGLQNKDIVEHMNSEVVQRVFGLWDMALPKPAKSELLALSTAGWSRSTQQRSSFESPMDLQLLTMFWNMRRQAA